MNRSAIEPYLNIRFLPETLNLALEDRIIDANGLLVTRLGSPSVQTAVESVTDSYVFEVRYRLSLWKVKSALKTRIDCFFTVDDRSITDVIFASGYSLKKIKSPAMRVLLRADDGTTLPGANIRSRDYHIARLMRFKPIKRGKADHLVRFNESRKVPSQLDPSETFSADIFFVSQAKIGVGLTTPYAET